MTQATTRELDGLISELETVCMNSTSSRSQSTERRPENVFHERSNNVGSIHTAANETRKAAFAASLSQLDCLLRELRTAQNAFSSVEPEQRLQESRNNIDKVLGHLDQLEGQDGDEQVIWGKFPTFLTRDRLEGATMECATRELEELMASLSSLKVARPNISPLVVDVHHDSPTMQLQSENSKLKDDAPAVTETSKCSKCDRVLENGECFEYNNKTLCKRHLDEMFNPTCLACNKPITERMITAFGHNWHPEHFSCSICGCKFDTGGFHLGLDGSNQIYCKTCFRDKVAPKCTRCNEPILDNYITALKSYWHPSCFTCTVCRSIFDSGYFFELDDKPYCESHYYFEKGLICAKCNGTISGRCISALSQKYHPEHFVCSFCSVELNRNTFREGYERPYCINCHEKLFG